MGSSSSIDKQPSPPSTSEANLAHEPNRALELNRIPEPNQAPEFNRPPEPQIYSRRFSIFPKYVKYVPTLHCINDDNVKVWWFPSDFCQSRLGDRVIGSNACTLIATIMAYRIEGHPISIQNYDYDQPLSRCLINALAESIVDGNEIHEDLIESGQQIELDLTLPEAMRFCVNHNYSDTTNNRQLTEFKSVFQMNQTARSLFEDVHSGIVEFETKITSPPPNGNLFMVLIADGMSVLVVYQQRFQQVTLIDTHGHDDMGAVVAQVAVNELQHLCKWYLDMRQKMHKNRLKSYELSFLYFKSEFPLL